MAYYDTDTFSKHICNINILSEKNPGCIHGKMFDTYRDTVDSR